MVKGQPGVHKSQQRLDEFEFLFFLNFLQHEDVIHGGRVESTPLHIQNGVSFLKRCVVFLGGETAIFFELSAKFGRLPIKLSLSFLRIANVLFPERGEEKS